MEENETAEAADQGLVVALGMSGGRKSKYILKWALENFLPEGNVTFKIIHVYPKITSVPTPMGGYLPIAQVREDIATGYRDEIELKKKNFFLPYQLFLKTKKINSDIIVLESNNTAVGLTLEVARQGIRHLVIGVSSTSIFSRKNLSLKKLVSDPISKVILDTTPTFCTVYVVADGKLQHTRPAESEQIEITTDDISGLSNRSSDCSPNSSSLTIGRLLKSRPSSPTHPTSIDSESSTSPSQLKEPVFLPQTKGSSKRLVRESIELKHYSFPEKQPNKSPAGRVTFRNQSVVSESSNSSGSWVSEQTSPTELPPNFLDDITPPGSHVGTPPSRFAGNTPPSLSFAETPPTGSAATTPPTVSFAETPPTASFLSDPSQQLPSSSFSMGASSSSYQLSELEQLRIELRHIQKMYELTQNSDASDKLSDSSKELLDESLNKGNAKELTSSDKNKHEAAQGGSGYSGKQAQRIASQNGAATKAASEAKDSEKKLEQLIAGSGRLYQKFTWKEIVQATSSFADEHKIGNGAFGTVFKCKLHHTTVAVKVLHSKDNATNKQFLQELEILSTIRHPHLLLLLGAVPEESCLVYEYMENGSLDDRLFRKNDTPPIPWYERFRICWEVSSALAFLHSTKPNPIIHRDLKPANILLDQHMVSKIGDAGLGTMIKVEPTSLSLKTVYKQTSPVGTLCYIDPEYQRTGRVSTKSDIYALGVVILQLLTAKPAVGIAYAIEDAIDEGNLMELLDTEAGQWPQKETLEMAMLALQCAELRGRDRPDLNEKILPSLERLKEIADAARVSASETSTAIPPHFICPILKDIMENPYVAADGYTYERRAIEQWLTENNTSPTTDLPLPHKFIMPNTTLLEAIKEWKSKTQSKS